jgi:hypothetical protein
MKNNISSSNVDNIDVIRDAVITNMVKGMILLKNSMIMKTKG